MLIYQQPPEDHYFLSPGGTFLRDSELSALLELVIPCYDEPLSPVEMVQFHSYGSPGYPSPASVCQSPLPVFPHQDAHDIYAGGASWFPVPKDANSIPLVMINNESFPGVIGVEPLTSLLRPDIALSVEVPQPKLLLEHQLPDTQACELVTPLEVYHQLKSTTAEMKCDQGQKHPCKPRAKCVVNGCNTQKQSHGRCIRHGGGKRCTVFGCSSGAQTMGLCKRHGGGSRCRVLNCDKSSQSGGLCRSHGGGTMCIAPGCKKGAQRQRKCAKHAPRKCAIDNCSNLSRCGGFCRRHHPFKK